MSTLADFDALTNPTGWDLGEVLSDSSDAGAALDEPRSPRSLARTAVQTSSDTQHACRPPFVVAWAGLDVELPPMQSCVNMHPSVLVAPVAPYLRSVDFSGFLCSLHSAPGGAHASSMKYQAELGWV